MGQETVELDGKQLRLIANKNETTRAITKSLSERERIRLYSDIIRTRSKLIREGERIVDSDYVQFWNELQDAGVGSIVYNQKKKPERFNWHYSLKEISKAMVDGKNPKVSPVATPVLSMDAEPPGAEGYEPLAQRVKFFLSETRMGELRLPDNFTMEEAEKVCKAIRTMAKG